MKKKVFVNARFLTQPITGVQRYGIEISRELKKIDPSIQFVSPKNILHHHIASELEVEKFGVLTGHFWEQIELPLYLKRHGNPLLINLTNTAPLFYSNKIVTIHDIAFERFPQTFSWKFRCFYKFLIPRLLKTSKQIITVSDFSRNEISETYNVHKKQIKVIYSSVASIFRKEDYFNNERYILAVSSLNYQKNFHSLIKAFNLIKLKDVKLYLVGGINRNFADISLIDEIKLNPNIIFKGQVNDEELVKLYNNAICFVYPSLYEGFGLPPLEAQACGCPVIVSNKASLPEVYKDSAIYCDPYNVDDIAEKIELLINDEQLQNTLRERGYENVMRFDWKRSAEQLYEVIKSI